MQSRESLSQVPGPALYTTLYRGNSAEGVGGSVCHRGGGLGAEGDEWHMSGSVCVSGECVCMCVCLCETAICVCVYLILRISLGSGGIQGEEPKQPAPHAFLGSFILSPHAHTLVTSTCVANVLKCTCNASIRKLYSCPSAASTACPRPWCTDRMSSCSACSMARRAVGASS